MMAVREFDEYNFTPCFDFIGSRVRVFQGIAYFLKQSRGIVFVAIVAIAANLKQNINIRTIVKWTDVGLCFVRSKKELVFVLSGTIIKVVSKQLMTP